MTNDFDNLLAATRIATLFLDENLELRKFTPEAKRIFRISDSDVGRPAWHIGNNLVDCDLNQVLKRVLSSGKSEELEAVTQGGECFMVWVMPYSIGSLQSSGLVVTFTDITSRKRSEARLIESEHNYRTLANSGPALIWGSGTDKLCNYFNQAWLDFTGRALETELGNGWTEGVHPEDLERCLSVYNSAFDKRTPFSMVYRLRGRDGVYRWIQDDGSPRYDSQGNFLGYIGFCLDITQQKEMERSLERHKSLFELTQELNRTGAWVMEVSDRTVLWSSEVYRIHGLKPDEMPKPGKNLMDITIDCLEERDRENFCEALGRCIKEGIGFALMLSMTDLKGSKKRIVAKARAVAENGKVGKVAGIFSVQDA